MNSKEFLKINKDGWNQLIASGVNFSNTSLPEYGPFMENEEKLQLFKNVRGKKILELGCAKGDSLKYLKENGACEVWGLDISEEQISKARENVSDAKFYVSCMEENPGIPTDYFDYVLILYSIGFSSDFSEVMMRVFEYLKKNGQVIICWTHPFFNCLGIADEKIVIQKSYYDEKEQMITKGPDKVPMVQKNLKISSIINTMISSSFVIDKVLEENPILENHIGDYKSTFWDARKLAACSTTLIIVAHK